MLSSRGKYCDVHKGQKLTHYIEDTKELICVYGAFARFKKNPKTEIKEIKDKCNEINAELSSIIEDNQHNVEMIQNALKDIKKNNTICGLEYALEKLKDMDEVASIEFEPDDIVRNPIIIILFFF